MRASTAYRSATSSSELDALIAYLDELTASLWRRDAATMARLLHRRLASHLPRAVREELLRVASQPAGGFRAAIEFYRYSHRMRQLAAAGEPFPRSQLELGLGRGAGTASDVEGWSPQSERGAPGARAADLSPDVSDDEE